MHFLELRCSRILYECINGCIPSCPPLTQSPVHSPKMCAPHERGWVSCRAWQHKALKSHDFVGGRPGAEWFKHRRCLGEAYSTRWAVLKVSELHIWLDNSASSLSLINPPLPKTYFASISVYGYSAAKKVTDRPGENSGLFHTGVIGQIFADTAYVAHALSKACRVAPIRGWEYSFVRALSLGS